MLWTSDETKNMGSQYNLVQFGTTLYNLRDVWADMNPAPSRDFVTPLHAREFRFIPLLLAY